MNYPNLLSKLWVLPGSFIERRTTGEYQPGPKQVHSRTTQKSALSLFAVCLETTP